MRSEVLGFPVDVLSRQETLGVIEDWIRRGSDKLRLIVTAYSEFYVIARKDNEFGEILSKADLVTPDGVSVLAAVKYIKGIKSTRRYDLVNRVISGLGVGGDILRGEVGETVTGVWLFENIAKMASKKGWKIFLLGGWDNVSGRVTEMLLKRFPDLRVECDAGETSVGTNDKTNKRVIEKINRFKPDILFVSYNPVKQEKWIYKNRNKLKAKIAMGVGGTFDEFAGDLMGTPLWMERMGLKWLWRVILQPKRFGRIMRAVIIFPWIVFQSTKK